MVAHVAILALAQKLTTAGTVACAGCEGIIRVAALCCLCVIMNHELIMAQSRSVFPEGGVIFVFVFDPKPEGTGTLAPPRRLLIQSVCECFHVERMTLKESI